MLRSYGPTETVDRAGAVFMTVLRVLFVLVLAAVGWTVQSLHGDLIVIGFIGTAMIVIAPAPVQNSLLILWLRSLCWSCRPF
ncbi:MAG: hypothetical protein ACPGXK_08715, partial [Phycisphaerae bacterium]